MASAQKVVHLLICGLGQIGSTLMDQLTCQAQVLASQRGLLLKVVGLVEYWGIVASPDGIPLNGWKAALEAGRGKVTDWPHLIEMLKKLPNAIVVDVTASADLPAQYPALLRAGISVVAANKKASSGTQAAYDLLQELTRGSSGPRLYIECNVGAGLPIISTLKGLVSAGDQVVTIEAVLSGTLSFIFNTFSADHTFSSVVRQAKQKGYTEPDPRDDLSGLDVARKILILSRIAGLKMELSDVQITPLLSAKVSAAASVDEFFTLLAAEDADYEAKRAAAAAEDKRLRFVAKLDMASKKATISLVAVDRTHPMYPLQGADNIVVFRTAYYSDRPLVVIGPGAGAAVTAAGVFTDILLHSIGQ